MSAGRSDDLHSDTLSRLRRSYPQAQVSRQKGSRPIGGAPTRSALVAVRAEGGGAVLIRTAVSRGPQLAHLTQMVIRDLECVRTIAEGQAIVESIEFTR